MSGEIQNDTQMDIILGDMPPYMRNLAYGDELTLTADDLVVLAELYESYKDMPPNPYWDRSGWDNGR